MTNMIKAVWWNYWVDHILFTAWHSKKLMIMEVKRRLTLYMRKGRCNSICCAVISYVILNFLIIIVRRCDIKIHCFSEKYSQSSSATAKLSLRRMSARQMLKLQYQKDCSGVDLLEMTDYKIQAVPLEAIPNKWWKYRKLKQKLAMFPQKWRYKLMLASILNPLAFFSFLN